MNVTDFRRSSAAVIIGTSTNSMALGGVTISSNAQAAPGWVLVATGSNSAIWQNSIAFGSNATDVGSISMGGSASSNSRSDHQHRGVRALSHASNTFYGPITFTTPGDSVGITSPVSGTLAFTASSGAGGGSDLSGQELAYVEKTTDTSITATTETTANTIVTATGVVCDGTMKVSIEFFSDEVTVPGAASNNFVVLVLYDDTGGGAASIGIIGVFLAVNSTSIRIPVFLARRLAPTAATHTYSVRAHVASGTGTVGAGAGGLGARSPAFIRITRV